MVSPGGTEGSETELRAGDVVDRYRVLRLLGRGGMGAVYLARDLDLGRKVALKFLRSSGGLDRLRAEARITARFNHPHIVTLYGVGEHGGRPYLALEYVPGESLRGRIVARGLSEGEAIRFAAAVADALAEAHSHGVIHGDLKPENVLIPPDGRVRVVDFGLARRAREPASDAAEGTPAYMAPERWNDAPLGPAADVWALGVMLHEMLAGRRPWQDSSPERLRLRICSPEPPPPLTGAPADVAAVAARCLSHEAADRPSAPDVAAALHGLLLGHGQAGSPPFPGLLPFTEGQADRFFGRDAELAEAFERLRRDAVVPVVGPSGAGKTSFVQAGVLPVLGQRDGRLILSLRPGARPLRALAGRLLTVIPPDALVSTRTPGSAAKAADPDPPTDDPRDALAAELRARPERLGLHLHELAERADRGVILFVDQLEEAYTLCDDPAEQQAFLAAVLAAGDDPADPVRVILTLRDDFLGRAAAGAHARQALGRVLVVRAPGPEALRAALVEPVARAGYSFDDPALAGEMVEAVGREPACLPMLQFTARLLWDRRDEAKRVVTRAAYSEIGGVAGALAAHADAAIAALSPARAQLARRILLRLVTPEATRRVLGEPELIDGLGGEARFVLDHLVASRLLTARRRGEVEGGESEVELAHESLAVTWRTLVRWIEEGREDLRFHAEVTAAAELWRRRGERAEETWVGVPLADALRAKRRAGHPLPEVAERFLAAGTQRQRWRARRIRAVVALVIAGLAAVALVLAQARGAAEDRRVESQHRLAQALVEGARAALRRGDFLEARSKVREALEIVDSPDARALWWALGHEPVRWRQYNFEETYAGAFAPDGKSVAIGGVDGMLFLMDVATRRTRPLPAPPQHVFAVGFSPASDKLAFAGADGRVRVVDLATDQVTELYRHRERIGATVFSPDGALLCSAGDDRVILWDVAAGRVARELAEPAATDCAFSPGGAFLATASVGGTARLWTAAGEPLGAPIPLAQPPRAVDVNDQGVLVTGGAGGDVRLWDGRTGQELYRLAGHTEKVWEATFSRDGRQVLTAGEDAAVRIWDTATGELRIVHRMRENVEPLRAAGWNPTGRHLFASGSDSTSVYDAATRPARVRETGETINSLAFVRDARMLVAGDHDGWVRLFDTETGALVRTLPGRGGKMRGVDARPGTAIVAAAGLDSAIRIWDLDTGQAPRVLFGHDGAIWDLRYSRDGRFIATASVDATVRVWDSDTGAMLHTLRHDQWVRAVAWGPGDALVTGGEDRKLRIWDARTGRGRVLAELDTQVSDLDVTPDGKKIVVVGENATISLWDATAGTGKVIARPPEKPFFLRILPDGASFVAVGGTVLRRWTLDGDGGGGGELLAVGHLSKVAVALSPDGRWVAQGDHTGMPTITELDASREHWRAPLIGGSPLRIYRHDGIVDPAGEGARAPGTAWERAVVEHGRSADVKDGLLCLITGDGRVELWDTASDSLARSADGSFARRTLRWRDGCLILGAGAEYLGRDGARVTLAAGATTIAVAGDDALVAVGDETRRFDAAGQVVARIRTGNAVTALTDAPEGLWAGYVDGRVILFPRQGGPGWPLPDRQYYVAVTSILSGPGGVLFVGYSYGRIVLRVRATGAEYFNTWVHGGVLALHGEGTRVTAVGTSGDYVVLDLSVLVEPRCAVLADVWSEVPTGWHDGQPVLRPPPASHPCR